MIWGLWSLSVWHTNVLSCLSVSGALATINRLSLLAQETPFCLQSIYSQFLTLRGVNRSINRNNHTSKCKKMCTFSKLGQENVLRMMMWMTWYCPPDTGLKTRSLAVWGQARYLSVKVDPHITASLQWAEKKPFVSLKLNATAVDDPHSRFSRQATLTTTSMIGLHVVRSESFSLTWSCESRQRDTTSSERKIQFK